MLVSLLLVFCCAPAQERPDAILPTMGGQTGLNLAKNMAESGMLDKYGVELIGAKLPSIDRAEDRELFKQAMKRIGLKTPLRCEAAKLRSCCCFGVAHTASGNEHKFWFCSSVEGKAAGCTKLNRFRLQRHCQEGDVIGLLLQTCWHISCILILALLFPCFHYYSGTASNIKRPWPLQRRSGNTLSSHRRLLLCPAVSCIFIALLQRHRQQH